MTEQFNAGLAYAEFKQRRTAYIAAACVAFLMSSYFVVGYLTGSLLIWEWTASQWLNGIVAVGLTGVMTAYQFFLYSQGDIEGGRKATILAVCVAVGFSLLSEIGQGMERDHIRMETKSLESPTYKALVGNLAGVSSSAGHPYSTDLQQAEMKLARCREKVAVGQWQDCVESTARLNGVRQMIAEHYQQTQNKALALASTAKSMEKDENNYHPLVNLIRQIVGASGTVASFLLSLILISFFEYAFHYLGGQYAEQRAILLRNGYDITNRLRHSPRSLVAAGRPAPPVSVQVPVQLPVAGDSNSENSTVYALAGQAKVGQEIECPQCGTRFQKANKWHLFCSNNRKPRPDGGNCSDDWHNANKPERAAAATKQGRVAG